VQGAGCRVWGVGFEASTPRCPGGICDYFQNTVRKWTHFRFKRVTCSLLSGPRVTNTKNARARARVCVCVCVCVCACACVCVCLFVGERL
jgi:hypothetical protein